MLYHQIKERKMEIRYNSQLTGHNQMLEYICGHEERIFNRTRMTKDCFNIFAKVLEASSRLKSSRVISVEEKQMIFLYVVAHVASSHKAQEDWQQSRSTISKYYTHVVTRIFEMYDQFIKPPDMSVIHPHILYNNKFYLLG